MSPTEFPEDVDTYLAQLERELGPMPAQERARIVQEISGHLAERAAVGPQMLHATIVQLGTPRALARSFIDDWTLTGALERRAGPPILWAILRRAWRSLAAIVIGTVGVLLYALSVTFAAVAVMKPITPHNVGLWVGPDGRLANFGIIYGATHDGPELLGWWVIHLSAIAEAQLWLAAGWALRNGGRLLLRNTAQRFDVTAQA